MDGHSKREVLEIFDIDKKNVIARCLFLNRPPIGQQFTIFRKMAVTNHVTD